MLFRAPELDPKELDVLAQIEGQRANFANATRTPSKRWTGLLRRNSFARSIRGSNSIEGYNVTVDDAIAATLGEEPTDASTETWSAITGYHSAMTYVLQLAGDRHFSYSAALLRSLHFMMVQHDLPKHPGTWRPGPIFVRDDDSGATVYEGPDAELIPELIDELIISLTDGTSSDVVRAALAHLNLVMIHPFSDGNGRMARCLQTLVLARYGHLDPVFCSIEEYLGRNTTAYYEVLAKVGAGAWHPERDTRAWIRFSLTAHHRQAVTLLRRTREINLHWDAVEFEVERRSLPDRTISALVDATMGFAVRNATYRQSAVVSEQVASRDLKMLVDAQLLKAVGERRGRKYVAAPALRDLVKGFREPPDIADPFA